MNSKKRGIARKFFHHPFCAAVLMLAFAPGIAQTLHSSAGTSAEVVERYPAGSIRSEEMADAALAATEVERTKIETRFLREEQACLPRFFSTSCIEEAKERRREDLRRMKAIDLEANSFKRHARAAERDKARDEKLAKELLPSIPQTGTKEETLRALPAKKDDKAEILNPVDRQARHAAKLRRLESEERAEAQERAENVAAYERKVQAVAERQKALARRKAEKEAKRASPPTQ